MKRIFVGITGASGHRYAEALIKSYVAAGGQVDLSVTGAGCKVLRHELGVEAGQHGEQLAASLPALGSVRAKAGTSSPLARRGR